MKPFVEGEDRRQATLLPECLDDFGAPDNLEIASSHDPGPTQSFSVVL